MSPFRPAALCVIALLACLPGALSAKPWWMRGVESNENDFLPPDAAFHLGASVEGSQVRVRWVIADGYYLYKQTIAIAAESPDLVLGRPELPRGIVKTDAYMGTQEIYTQQLETRVAYTRIDAGAHPMQIKVSYQGCAEAGLCYPPITRVVFPSLGPPPQAYGGDARPWEITAILAGAAAFLIAGFVLRRDRKLDLPAQ